MYCYIGVHVSEVERNYELDERVQSYLAKRGNLESERVRCHLCRSMYDHCTTCPHCDRQLCDLCFKEHVDEFHTMVREKLRSLRNEAGRLKQIRATLVSHRSTVKLRRMKFFQSIESASNDLLSACKTAVSKSESYLNRVRTQSKEKFTALLNNRKLVELVIYLHRAANNPAQHEDTRKLCNLRKLAEVVLKRLTVVETAELQNDQNAVENFTLAENLQSIGLQLLNFHLLVHQGSVAVSTVEKVCLQNNSHHQPLSTPKTVAGLKASGRSEQDHGLEPCHPKHPLGTTKLKASISHKPIQQQQQQQQDKELKKQQKKQEKKQRKKIRRQEVRQLRRQERKQQLKQKRQHLQQQKMDLKEHLALSRSQKALELFVDGVKSEISAENLRTHFEVFGEVLDFLMPTNSSKTRHRGCGYITLRPTGYPNPILDTEHTVCGIRINVRKYNVSDDVKSKSVRRVSKSMQYLTLGRPPTKKKTPCPREPPPGQDWQTEQQQQQRPQKPSQQQTDPQNLKLSIDGMKSFISADILNAYFARFGEVLRVNLHVDPTTNKPDGSGCITLRSTADKNRIRDTQHIICGVRINVKKCSPLNDAKIGSVMKQGMALEPLPSKRQLANANQKAPFSCQRILQHLPPQQQNDSLKQQAVDKSQKPLELVVDGVKAEITVEDLTTYFARFGEVFSVTISTNPVTNKPNGSGKIRLRSTAECSQMLETEHLVCGVRINVRSAVYPTTRKITQ